MNFDHVLLLTVLLGVSACATSVYDANDVEQTAPQDVDLIIEHNERVNSDPMIEHNGRLIKEGQEDAWRKNL